MKNAKFRVIQKFGCSSPNLAFFGRCLAFFRRAHLATLVGMRFSTNDQPCRCGAARFTVLYSSTSTVSLCKLINAIRVENGLQQTVFAQDISETRPPPKKFKMHAGQLSLTNFTRTTRTTPVLEFLPGYYYNSDISI